MKNNPIIAFVLFNCIFSSVIAQESVTNEQMYDQMYKVKDNVDQQIQNGDVLKGIKTQVSQTEIDGLKDFFDSKTPSQDAKKEATSLLTQNMSNEAKSVLDNFDKPEQITSKPSDKEDNRKVFYFVSFSLPKQTLKTIISMAADEPGAVVLFRGLKDQTNFSTHQKALLELTKKMDKLPKLGLDPLAFRKYDIHLVPSIVLRQGDNAYQARGVISVEKMKQIIIDFKKSNNENHYLGKFSDTYEIAEMDLIELMKIRFAKIDWEKKGEEVKKKFWNGNKRFIDLPKVTKDSTRVIPSMVRISGDIKGYGGAILARKGEQFDLAKKQPLSKWYFILDATDKKQMAYIKTIREKAQKEGRSVKIIFNKFHGDLGWKEFNRLSKEIKQPVYILQKNMKDRFNIKAVPSLIHQVGDKLMIQEYYLGEL